MSMFDVIGRASVGVFGESVTIQRGAAAAISIRAVFDSNFYAADDGEFASVDKVTTISVRDSDAPSIAVDDRVIARGVAYKVTERRPDSEGMTVYELQAI